MNRNLHSPTTLTEFARDFEDEPETLFQKFVSKLTQVYNTSYNTVNDLSNNGQSNFSPVNNVNNNPGNVGRSSSDLNISSLKYQSSNLSTEGISSNVSGASGFSTSETPRRINVETNEGRTTVNVLKRISNIVAVRNNNLRSYKDTDLQRLWMPDSKAKECYDCSEKFSVFRRKHHCRLCGQIFCSECCNQVVPGKIIMCSGTLKVCTYCSKIVLSYLKSPDITQDLKADLQALEDDLSNKLSMITTYNNENSSLENSNLSNNRKISVGYQEEKLISKQCTNLSNADRKNILQQSNSLKTLHDEMIDLLPLQNCGNDLIIFLIANQKSSNNIQAKAILNAMLEAGFIVPIVPDSDQIEFDENLHYKLVRKTDIMTHSGNFQLDLDLDTTSVHMSRSIQENDNPTFESEIFLPKSIDESLSFQSVKEIELENSIRSTTRTAKQLVKSYCDHEELLLNQLLRNENLDESWAKTLIPLCARAVNQFRPENCTNDLMDIRNYVNFKKVPGGLRNDCSIIGGIVFSKNVAHKEMSTRIENPQILLLKCPIVYERVEGKFVSFETLLLQEKEYLRNVTVRILNLKPKIVLVHKNVAGIAQDMLRAKGITLVLDVKTTVLERLARHLNCDIVQSIESNIEKPKLGSCDLFYIKSFDEEEKKTLMVFEKMSSAKGCACLLRGGSKSELQRVKRVASLLLYARHNWRLEMSFLLDEFACPPSPKSIIFDSKENSPSDQEEDLNISSIKNKDKDKNNIKLDYNVESNDIQNNHKKLNERKSEEKLICIENVNDFTDPLRAIDLSPTRFEADSLVKFAVHTPYDNRFRTALSSIVLSVSPYVLFPLPYLETEQGRKCKLRSHFSNELFYSKQLSDKNEKPIQCDIENLIENNVSKLNPLHEFVKYKITKPFDSNEIQTLLAEFRAYGGRYPKSIGPFNKFQKPIKQKNYDESIYKDALDFANHQRLPVMFCNFYLNPKASSFCAKPTLLDMKFYGQHDIMLGQFLQHYCFRSSYICQSCNLPMLYHVRRYVHSLGCVQVNVSEDTTKNDIDKIYLTSLCGICNEMTPSVPLSEDSKNLSFAKYLELRFHGHAYKKRVSDISESSSETDTNNLLVNDKCQHSLHKDYINYFSYKGIVARFAYKSIEILEINLPLSVIHLKKPKPFDNLQVLDDIKHFSIKGHEVYSNIHEKIAEMSIEEETPILGNLKSILNKDQFIFRQQVEIVQTLLTEKYANSYDINDGMLMLKRVLAESLEIWGTRLYEASLQNKNLQKQENPISNIDSGNICTEDIKNDLESPQIEKRQRTISFTDSNKSDIVTDIDNNSIKTKELTPKTGQEISSDKKSIKQFWSQLLPSSNPVILIQSPLSLNEHLTLPLGAFPILVHDHDLSSIIAYSLTTNDYKKAVENMNLNIIAQNSDISSTGSPSVKRKSQDGPLESEDREPVKSEEEKKAKTNSHIELNFQDLTTHFTCKIYFAKEFDIIRSKCIKTPDLGKSIYKNLELEKKEELKNSSNIIDNEQIKKLNDQNINSGNIYTQSDDIIEETRIFLARSLCRSIQWEARGGKSGSKFSKTLDDRFILKEMSKTDVAIFESFAPNYFEYINQCLEKQYTTLLAKILGVFKVTIKKKDSLQDKSLLVMENLFFDCEINRKFDLKGSERNRLVDPTNQHGEIVLLDENLIQMSWSQPLYVLSHSKMILCDAINRDSAFLEKNSVMDYSLLVGLNSKDDTLVLGIIDYIRTYTLDKKLESFVKQSVRLGGQGKLPTVISPPLYRQRFIEAMNRYFFSVPDRWEGLCKY